MSRANSWSIDDELKKYLADILVAIEEINQFIPPDTKDFHRFVNDLKTKRAVERNLEIIGEAVNRILKLRPEIQISSSKQIVGIRNVIINAYDNLSYENIWGIVTRHIPLLKADVEKLLTE